MEIEVVCGKFSKPFAEVVTSMRMSSFKEWPYLYAGDSKTEADYIDLYMRSKNSLLILGREKGKIVGVITGIPLQELDEYFLAPFRENCVSLDSKFYLGEILLDKQFRGKGLGSKMYDAFECAVKKQV